MGSRTRIAAAACLIASGLLATGSSASLAFANPDAGSPGSEGGSGTGSTPGAGTGAGTGTGAGQPTGSPTGSTPTGTSTAPSSGPFGSLGPFGSIFRPPTTVGNGRTGFGFDLPDIGSWLPTGAPPKTTAPSKAPSAPSGTPAAPTGSSSAPSPSAAAPTSASQAVADVAVEPKTGIGTGAEDPTSTPASVAAAWPLSWWNAVPAGTPAGDGKFGTIVQQPISSLPYATQVLQLPQQALTQLLAPAAAIPGLTAFTDPIVQAVSGLATAASELPFLSVTLPVIVVPPGTDTGVTPVIGSGRTPASRTPQVTAPAKSLPAIPPAATPTETSAPEPTQKAPPPAVATSTELLAAPAYRMGYVDYLRAAGLGEVAAVAVPGVTGILVLTGAGGLIGFRQARAGRAVRAGGPARFMG